MARITTTLGFKCPFELGSILPHERIVVDLMIWDTPGHTQADVEEVIQLMVQEIKKA
jgi:hypothetical protein